METPHERQSPRPEIRRTLGGRLTAMRMFRTKDAGVMVVYEQESTSADSPTRELVFEAPSGTVRLTAFPAEWHRLKDEQLVGIWEGLAR